MSMRLDVRMQRTYRMMHLQCPVRLGRVRCGKVRLCEGGTEGLESDYARLFYLPHHSTDLVPRGARGVVNLKAERAEHADAIRPISVKAYPVAALKSIAHDCIDDAIWRHRGHNRGRRLFTICVVHSEAIAKVAENATEKAEGLAQHEVNARSPAGLVYIAIAFSRGRSAATATSNCDKKEGVSSASP